MRNDPKDIVFVVDDDASIRTALSSLIRSVGLQVEVFSSVTEFLKSARPDARCCLVLDVRLPGVSGLEFQKQLSKDKNPIPIIFISGHGDIPMAVQAIQAGAVDFLPKPFRDQDLLDAIHKALQRDQHHKQDQAQVSVLQHRYHALTQREKELLPWLVAGRLNKQIAERMGISENTVKVHRSNILHKMHAATLVELLRIAEKLHIPVPTADC